MRSVKKNCPLIRGVHFLDCPLIGENTVLDMIDFINKRYKVFNFKAIKQVVLALTSYKYLM